MSFRFPDKPGLEIIPSQLKFISPKLYFATLKYDGWRCLAERRDGVWYFTSRTNKPMQLPADLVERLEGAIRHIPVVLNQLLLDCELTGKRREGDAKDIKVLDLLELDHEDKRWLGHRDRFALCKAIVADHSIITESSEDFQAFFDWHKVNTPLAEGIVLRAINGTRLDSPVALVKNKNMIKVKWRAGDDGLAPVEM